MTKGPAICVEPFKIVNVTLPSLIVPAGLLTLAESDDPFAGDLAEGGACRRKRRWSSPPR